MYLEIQVIDSEIFGKPFAEIKSFSNDINFERFEQDYVTEYNPFYVSCKIPIENIEEIHSLEKAGFNFIEVQIRETFSIPKKLKLPVVPGYAFEEVTSEEDLQQVLNIASTCFEHDRFTIDKKLNKSFSAERYKDYVKKSFIEPDEYVYKLTDIESNEIVGFKTHKLIENEEALMFLGGVANQYKKTAIPVISGTLELLELQKKGVKKLTTHVSARNYGVINLELRGFKFKINQAYVVLRKIYSDER